MWANLPYSLKVVGFTSDYQVLFNYKNEEQGFEQSFSVNVKKYNGHQEKAPLLWRSKIDEKKMSTAELLDRERNEGIYIFLPQWNDQLPKQYSKLVQDVQYFKGELVEQTTIIYTNNEAKEHAMIKVRFSPLMQEIVEFEVELGPIPVVEDF